MKQLTHKTSYDFNSEVALVTGASRGIGKQIALDLLNSNCLVIGTYASDESSANSCREDFRIYGDRFELIKKDVSIKSNINYIFDHAHSKWGKGVEMLVNNAGILKQGVFSELSANQWSQTLKVNLEAPFLLCQEFLKRCENKGSIVNIASIGGQTGGDKAPDYAASKAAIISLTRSIARIGSESNVRSNAVSPGWILTDIFSEKQLKNLKIEAKSQIPLGRMGSPVEVSKAVMFLLSDEASYITGHCLNVNGGLYLG